MDPKTEVIVKGALSLIALAAVVWRHRAGNHLKPEKAGQILGLVAVIAALAYTNFGQFHGRSGIHHWEQFHYFLGSKYFSELRYDGLYAASLIAEEEISLGHPPQHFMRDLRNNEVVPSSSLRSHGRDIQKRFSSGRWRDFVADVAYFLRSNDYGYITSIRNDHGYNPTPTWTFSAQLFSRWPAANDGSLTALAWIDPMLLIVLFVMIFRTYGSRVGCLALIIFGLGYPWRFDWVGGAFLRQDWLAAVGAAVCLLRRERFALAGGLLAYASMVRVFPAAFLVGAAVLGIQALARRQPTRWVARVAAGFAAGIVLSLAVGSLTGIGAAAWPQFWANLQKHHGTWLTNNVGLRNTVLYDTRTMTRKDVDFRLPEPWIHWQARMNRIEQERRPAIFVLSGLFIAAAVLTARRQRIDRASVLGIVIAFSLVVLTCYYWVMLLLVPLGRGRWRPTAGWLAINTACYALHQLTQSFEMIFGLLSWALALYFMAWMAPDVVGSIREMRRTTSSREAR